MIFNFRKWFILLFLVGWSFNPLQADNAAGKIILAVGEVSVTRASEKITIKRGDWVYQGDLISLGANSNAQIRFKDGALMSLKAQTELKIDAFLYQANQVDEKAVFNLIKGGLRSITGSIGKEGNDEYKVKTQYATLGIRGTHYAMAIATDRLFVTTFSGVTVLTNKVSSIELGVNQAFHSAEVKLETEPVKGLNQVPAVISREATLNQSVAEPPNSKTTPKEQPRQESSKPPVAIPPTLLPQQPTKGLNPVNVPSLPQPLLVPLTSQQEVIANSTNDVIRQTTVTQVQQQAEQQVALTSGDVRFSPAEFTAANRKGGLYTAGLDESTEDVDEGQETIKATDGSGGNPLFLVYEQEDQPPHFVVKKGATAFEAITLAEDESLPLGMSLGIWRGDTTSPLRALTDPRNLTSARLIDDFTLWFTAVPTANTLLARLTGEVTYSQTNFAFAKANNGSLQDFHLSYTLNFSTEEITGGILSLVTGSSSGTARDHWQFEFVGRLDEDNPATPIFYTEGQTKIIGTVNRDIAAELIFDSVLIGDYGQYAGGGFRASDAENRGLFVAGLYATQIDLSVLGALGFDRRLSQAEIADMLAKERIGFLVIATERDYGFFTEREGASNIFFGPAAKINTDFVIKDVETLGGTVFRRNQAPQDNLGSALIAGTQVDWGRWLATTSLTASAQTNPMDATVITPIKDQIAFITATPADESVLFAKTGRASYADVTILGKGFNGDISNVNMLLDVDFNDQAVSGAMSFDTGTRSSAAGIAAWDMDLQGSMHGAALELSVTEGTVSYNGSQNIKGESLGSFIGNGNGIVGAFEVKAINDPSIHAEGAYLLCADC